MGFEGQQLRGGPEYVIFKGRMVADQGLFRPMTGYGQFQPCPPFPKELYTKIKERKGARMIAPVTRSVQDMAIVSGSDKMPSPTPSEDTAKDTNQQKSRLDMTQHPQTPDFDSSSVRNSPSRSSVRVRAPPGGASSGLW